ncbi:unnamed protein product [Discosporangium mesarthrocarpum]
MWVSQAKLLRNSGPMRYLVGSTRKSSTDVVIASFARTPIGKFGGEMSALSGPQLGAVTVREAVERAGIEPGLIQEVLLGNVIGAGAGQAPARQAALYGGEGVRCRPRALRCWPRKIRVK